MISDRFNLYTHDSPSLTRKKSLDVTERIPFVQEQLWIFESQRRKTLKPLRNDQETEYREEAPPKSW